MLERIAVLAALCVFTVAAHAVDWPQEITAPEGTLLVYQPQPESLKGNQLTGRAALSIEIEGREPIFGAMWFTSRIDTDHDANTVVVRDIKVTKTGWPESTFAPIRIGPLP